MFTLIMQTYVTNLTDGELEDLGIMNGFGEVLKEFEDGELAIKDITSAADKALDGRNFIKRYQHLPLLLV